MIMSWYVLLVDKTKYSIILLICRDKLITQYRTQEMTKHVNHCSCKSCLQNRTIIIKQFTIHKKQVHFSQLHLQILHLDNDYDKITIIQLDLNHINRLFCHCKLSTDMTFDCCWGQDTFM